MNSSARMEQQEVLRLQLHVLRQEHHDLDTAIHALQDAGNSNALTVKRLKKQKLALKDKIAVIEDRMIPDIIA